MQIDQAEKQRQRKKQKILNKYLSEENIQQKNNYVINSQNYLIRDNDDIVRKEVSDYQEISSQSNQLKRKVNRRVYSSDEQHQAISKKVKTEEPQRHHRINKKLKKAFGFKGNNQQDNQQDFLNEVKIEGINEQQLKQYLKKNRKAQIVLEVEGKKQKKQKRKQKKQKRKRHNSSDQVKSSEQDQNQKLKKQLFAKSQSSDLQIPQQSRTVYRNKDGTIRNESQQQQKQRRKEMVMQRLAEWEKGMKRPDKKGQGSSDSEQDYQIELAKKQLFDDPMRRWQAQTKQVNPLRCKFEGYANRFNIKPGFRWDGVIRGNGYENKYLQQKNLRKLDQDKKARQYLKNL